MGSRTAPGYRLLGDELRQRRGGRTLREIEHLSRSSAFGGTLSPVSSSTLNSIENGHQTPSVDTLLSLSAVYGVPAQRFANLMRLERLAARRPAESRPEALLAALEAAASSGDYLALYGAALRGTEVSGEHPARPRFAMARGAALWKLGFLDEAAAVFRDLLRDEGLTPEQEMKAWFNLAAVHKTEGNLRMAELAAAQCLSVTESKGTATDRATARRLRGTICVARAEEALHEGLARGVDGLLREALRNLSKAEALFEQAGDAAQALSCRVVRGLAFFLDEAFAQSRALLDRAVEEARALGHQELLAGALATRAKTSWLRGELDSARQDFLAAERHAAASGHAEFQFDCCFYLDRIERAEGKTSRLFHRRCLSLRSHLQGDRPELRDFDRDLSAARSPRAASQE